MGNYDTTGGKNFFKWFFDSKENIFILLFANALFGYAFWREYHNDYISTLVGTWISFNVTYFIASYITWFKDKGGRK